MSIPDGFKVSEVGVIPVDWDVKRLGDIVIKIVGGGTPSRNIKEYWNGNIFWATVKDLTSFNSYLTQETITKEGLNSSASNLIPKGNLIISTRMAVGKVVIYNVDVAINQDLKAIFIKPDIDTRFLFFYFIGYSNKIDFLASGSTVKGIVLEDLRNLQIPLPPLAEQKAIAQSLSDVDNLITAIDKLITKKRNIKQGTMQELLTGKKRLPGFSGEWEVKYLRDCLIKNPDYGINAAAVPYSDMLPTYIRITDISEDGNFLAENKVSVIHQNAHNYFLEIGDIVLARTGASTGKSYLYNVKDGKLVFAGFLIRVRPDTQKLYPQYLKGYLETQSYWNWVKVMSMRSGQPGINGNEYSHLKIPLPPLPEQKAIAKILTEMDEEIEALEKKREKYKNIKQGMMQELLTGKTRIIDN